MFGPYTPGLPEQLSTIVCETLPIRNLEIILRRLIFRKFPAYPTSQLSFYPAKIDKR